MGKVAAGQRHVGQIHLPHRQSRHIDAGQISPEMAQQIEQVASGIAGIGLQRLPVSTASGLELGKNSLELAANDSPG